MNFSWRKKLWGAFVRLFGKQVYFAVYRMTGVRLSSETYYVDWAQINASFPASLEKVRAVMPSSKLKPVEIAPGKTRVVISGNHFRKILSLPPYEEVGIYVPVTYQGSGAVGDCPHYYILSLPVTIEAARWGGADLLGMPKFVTPIQYEETEKTITFRVLVDGKDTIRLEAPRISTQFTSADSGYYGMRDGQYIRTRMHLEGTVGRVVGETGASFVLGSHPMADIIRSLGIEETPLEYSYMDRASAILYKPDLFLPM